jgi:DNA-binding CsgD family transcriptional regulator
MVLPQIKKLLTSKEILMRVKKCLQIQRRIFVSYSFVRGLISRIYKKLNMKRINNPVNK